MIRLGSVDLDDEVETWNPQRDLLNSKGAKPSSSPKWKRTARRAFALATTPTGSVPNSARNSPRRVIALATGHGRERWRRSAFPHRHDMCPASPACAIRMPAKGGVEPETMDEVRHRAPYAFRTQDRAVTEADYAAMAELQSRGAARRRDVPLDRELAYGVCDRGSVRRRDRRGNGRNNSSRQEVLAGLERYRMAGHDLEADEPFYVSLEIEMHVCVKPDYLPERRSRSAARSLWQSRARPMGAGACFIRTTSPSDSRFISARFTRRRRRSGCGLSAHHDVPKAGSAEQRGVAGRQLKLDRLEIARCDNDPNFPERGVFRIELGGGK